MILQPYQVCHYSHKCPYHNSSNICAGTDPKRDFIFTCSYVNIDGTFNEGSLRNQFDVTGKMEILREDQ